MPHSWKYITYNTDSVYCAVEMYSMINGGKFKNFVIRNYVENSQKKWRFCYYIVTEFGGKASSLPLVFYAPASPGLANQRNRQDLTGTV